MTQTFIEDQFLTKEIIVAGGSYWAENGGVAILPLKKRSA
jgi:hypothetical protein